MSKTDNTKSKRKKTVIVDKYLYLESVEENFDTGITEEEWDKMSERDKYDFMCEWENELEYDTSNHNAYKFEIKVHHNGEEIVY
tara:strand:+ start:3537 stop:3788 length:252 start_codon:yes stop_codon:yes gene_type:complete